VRKRLLAGALGTLLLLLPAVTAAADEDPVPQTWPTIEDPGTNGGGTASDPKPADWPEVTQPDAGSGNDPKPTEWPAPEQG
jgi:hypothetical protein